jgi:hypothetical protein
MPGPLKLRAQLPDDRHNGLVDPAKVTDFLSQPRNAVLVVGVLYCPTTEVNNETGASVPVVRFKHIEVVSPGHDAYGLVAEILHQEHQGRTGEMMLPFPPGEDIRISGETDSNEE